MVKHIVLFRMKPTTSPAKIAEIEQALADLVARMEGLEDFLWGPYSSNEGLNRGYTHGFIMSFSDAAARDAYLPHPDHRAVADLILPAVDEVLAFDFEC